MQWRPAHVCLHVASIVALAASWAQLISPESTAVSWSFLTLSLLQGARSLPPATEPCRCLFVCVCVCVGACHSSMHACISMHMSTLKELRSMLSMCHDAMWVISLGRNLHYQEEGVTRCLRLRRWNATMAITVISAHIHLLQASWFFPSFLLALSPIYEHTLHLPQPQNNHNEHTQSMEEFRLHTHAYTIFPLTPTLKQEKVPGLDSKQTNMKRFLAG